MSIAEPDIDTPTGSFVYEDGAGRLRLWGEPTRPEEVAGDRIEIVNSNGFKLGEVLDFSLTGPTWEWGVGPASASFSTHPMNPTIQNLPIRTRGVEVFITTSTGETWWGYPDSKSDGSPNSLTFNCKGLKQLLSRRAIDRSSLLFTNVATGEIMRQLVFYAQSETHQNFRYENLWPRVVDYGFRADQRWSVRQRSRKYDRQEHDFILDLLDEFRQLDTPIITDIGWDPMPPTSSSGARRYLNITPWYDEPFPLAFPLVYAQNSDGSNILNFNGYEESGEDVANDLYLTGGTSGDVQFEVHVTDQASAEARGLQTDVVSIGDSRDVDWMTARGRKMLAERREPDVSFSLEVVTVPASVGLLMQPGSIWPVRIYCGAIYVYGNFRILSKTYNANGSYSIRLQAVNKVLRPYSPAFEWGGPT